MTIHTDFPWTITLVEGINRHNGRRLRELCDQLGSEEIRDLGRPIARYWGSPKRGRAALLIISPYEMDIRGRIQKRGMVMKYIGRGEESISMSVCKDWVKGEGPAFGDMPTIGISQPEDEIRQARLRNLRDRAQK